MGFKSPRWKTESAMCKA